MKKLLIFLLVVLWTGVAFAGAISMDNIDDWGILKEHASSSVVLYDGMLRIQAGNDPMFQNDHVTVSQSFELCEGEELSGWSRFYTEDYPPYHFDYASVTIGWSDGYQLMWKQDISSAYDIMGTTDNGYADTGWSRWAFTAPKTGLYNLIFYAQGDDQMDSYAYHRDLAIGCKCRPVPEPATIVLAGIGMVFIAGLKRRIK